jgi:RNA polymerase sigma factor (sigma-70 family)
MAENPGNAKWDLTPEALDSLLACFSADRDEAAAIYERTRRNLVRFFLGRGFGLAEDHADEVFNRMARRASGGEQIREHSSYSYGVARMVLLELLKEKEREQKAFRDASHLQLVQGHDDDAAEFEGELISLRQCMKQLPEEGRALILKYYQGAQKEKIDLRQRLAAVLGISVPTLRKRVERLRCTLEACVKRRLGQA